MIEVLQTIAFVFYLLPVLAIQFAPQVILFVTFWAATYIYSLKLKKSANHSRITKWLDMVLVIFNIVAVLGVLFAIISIIALGSAIKADSGVL